MPAAVAAAAAAAASGGALLLYLLLTCRPQPAPDAEREEEQAPLLSGSGAAQGRDSGDEREEPWPDRAPVTCCEAATVAARTARRTWELTVGRWGLHGIAFGIKRHMKRQGNLQHEYSGNDCRQLKGPEAHTEVSSLLEYLKLCMFFSKKSFSAFLKFGGYNQEDILIHKARARVMVSSKLDDVQDQGKIADHGSGITEPLLKDAAGMVQPATNGHHTDYSQHSDERLVLVGTEEVIVKSSVSGLTSEEDSDNNRASDAQQQSLPANEEVPKQNDVGKDKQKNSLSASSSRQFFPPGRIIHMVALPPPDSDTGEGTSSNEIIGVYETPRDLYDSDPGEGTSSNEIIGIYKTPRALYGK
ncbi:hypothetical protein PR202_ga14065 [Eleusine coracana subsp. coracana]|uniref:Uncharacterized protein n=1 Tax=Eleusine coracana subsp. coracana TaxID=191504 RepID=A0AAV5CGB9_ELECO|nr:hypothetical protein PR202_ga14065 [Eleusine coracana subsp. coracana]